MQEPDLASAGQPCTNANAIQKVLMKNGALLRDTLIRCPVLLNRLHKRAVAKACKKWRDVSHRTPRPSFPSYDQKKKRKPTCMTRCPLLPLTPPNTGESGSLMMLPKFA
jgi:hypothetical protein